MVFCTGDKIYHKKMWFRCSYQLFSFKNIFGVWFFFFFLHQDFAITTLHCPRMDSRISLSLTEAGFSQIQPLFLWQHNCLQACFPQMKKLWTWIFLSKHARTLSRQLSPCFSNTHEGTESWRSSYQLSMHGYPICTTTINR